MTEKIQKLMNDSALARWGALILIALMMFFAYVISISAREVRQRMHVRMCS